MERLSEKLRLDPNRSSSDREHSRLEHYRDIELNAPSNGRDDNNDTEFKTALVNEGRHATSDRHTGLSASWESIS